jgi:hypothetical protein
MHDDYISFFVPGRAKTPLHHWCADKGFVVFNGEDSRPVTHKSLAGGKYSIPDEDYEEFCVQLMQSVQVHRSEYTSIHEDAYPVCRLFLDVDLSVPIGPREPNEALVEHYQALGDAAMKVLCSCLQTLDKRFVEGAITYSPCHVDPWKPTYLHWGYHVYALGSDPNQTLLITAQDGKKLVAVLLKLLRKKCPHPLGQEEKDVTWTHMLDDKVYRSRGMGLRMSGCFKVSDCPRHFHSDSCCGDQRPYKLADPKGIHRPLAHWRVRDNGKKGRFFPPPTDWLHDGYPSLTFLLLTSLRTPNLHTPSTFSWSGVTEPLPIRDIPSSAPSSPPRQRVVLTRKRKIVETETLTTDWVDLRMTDPRVQAILDKRNFLPPVWTNQLRAVSANGNGSRYNVWAPTTFCLRLRDIRPQNANHKSASNYIQITPGRVFLRCRCQHDTCKGWSKDLGYLPEDLKSILFPSFNSDDNRLSWRLGRAVRTVEAEMCAQTEIPPEPTTTTAAGKPSPAKAPRREYRCGHCKQVKTRGGHQCAGLVRTDF